MYESDAKMLAGKEKREMEALFGKKSPVSAQATTKKYEPSSSASGKLPSMFAGGGGASGTLMSSGSASTMKVERGVYDSATGGAKASGKPMDQGGVSKLNMGSAGVMDTSREPIVDVANRGKFGGSSSNSTVSKLNMGSAGVMDTTRSAHVDVANRGSFGAKASGNSHASAPKTISRDPMSQHGVLRKFAWEQ